MRKAALLSLGMSLLLFGCLHSPDPGIAALPPDAAPPYTLRPGDVVDIEIAGEAEMSGQFPIEWDGTIALPLIGSLPAAGSTVASFQEELRKRLLADYFRNPVLTASLVATAARPAPVPAQWTSPSLRQSELSTDNAVPSTAIPELRVSSEQ
jgi:polysaccharide export outer membrane protein